MSPKCIDVERIAELAALPADHESRRHADECPRCRSLLLSYRSFMEASTTPGADVASARRALEATIRSHAGSAFPGVTPPATRLARGRIWAALLRPAPVFALAALLVLAAVVVWRGGEPETTVLRGADDAGGPVLEAPAATPDGIRLSWSPVADADGYEVRLFDDTLNEVGRFSAVEPWRVVATGSLGAAPGTRLTWRVVALRGGDTIATSAPGSVTLP